MYLVNKIQFRLNLYFELFDLENMYEFDDVIGSHETVRGPPPPPAYTTYVVSLTSEELHYQGHQLQSSKGIQ